MSTDLAGVGGIEPTGLGVKGPCLNHLAKPLYETYFNWQAGRDSNPHRMDLESIVLAVGTTDLWNLVLIEGFEPPTRYLQGSRSGLTELNQRITSCSFGLSLC